MYFLEAPKSCARLFSASKGSLAKATDQNYSRDDFLANRTSPEVSLAVAHLLLAGKEGRSRKFCKNQNVYNSRSKAGTDL